MLGEMIGVGHDVRLSTVHPPVGFRHVTWAVEMPASRPNIPPAHPPSVRADQGPSRPIGAEVHDLDVQGECPAEAAEAAEAMEA